MLLKCQITPNTNKNEFFASYKMLRKGIEILIHFNHLKKKKYFCEFYNQFVLLALPHITFIEIMQSLKC